MAALDAMEPEVAPSCYEEAEVPCLPPPAVSPVSTASSSPPPPALASAPGAQTLPSPGEEYLRMLRRERRTLDAVPGAALSLAHKLITQEMERIQGGGRPPAGGVLDLNQVSANQQQQQQHQGSTTNHHSGGSGGGGGGGGGRSSEERRIADITKEKPIKVSVRVLVPAKEHPKFNFVGKLLGPKGNSLKRLQEETMTKMAILGRGSMKDKHKEEELRGSGDPRYSHLNEELHVEVTAFAAPAEAHARIAYALAEIRRFLVPDYNDEIRQEQMREMQLMQSADAIELSGCMEEGAAGGEVCSEGAVRGADTPQTPPSPPPHQVSPPQAAGASKQEGGGRVYMHPTLRGISRSHGIPPPGTVYRASILSRLRPPQARMLMAAAAAAGVAPGPTGQSLGAASGASAAAAPPHPALHPPHHKRGLFPFLARFGGGAAAGTGVMSSMIGGEESVLGIYDGYSGGGYNLLEEGLGDEMMEDISQDSMKGAAAAAAVAAAAAAAEFGARGAAEANGTANATGPLVSSSAVQAAAAAASSLLKAERGRFRHDPYGRYAAKLPL